ncbi:MAG: hypothetical protein K8T91_00860 [Planctomycetes bacterium]|nr:hypothetical protein [Planctomycetota bacterium]
MSKPSLQSAVPSALGYYFQSLYALVLLCDAEDDAGISIETDDDLLLEGDVNKLVQLKHSLADKAHLSITDTGLWKAIRNWSPRTRDGTEQFLFVTRAVITDDSALYPLIKPNTHRKELVAALVAEATRVMDERTAAEKAGKKPIPHQERYKGCEAFLALNPKSQQQLVKFIQIPLDAPTAADVPEILSKKLGSMLLPNVREIIIERLIQWWDREVLLSLLGKRLRSLSKQELQTALNRLIIEHGEESLPDDFSPLQPTGNDDGVGRFMQRQIDWVNGGIARLNRAALARWRARNQREAWMRKEISIAQELRKYDDYLVEQWKDRFAPAKEDCKSSDEQAQCKVGLILLDWSHLNAPKDVRPIRKLWEHAYLIQGTFQQLAEQGDVGWHPDYEAKYKALKEST